MTEAQARASKKYEKKCKNFLLRCRRDKDEDIIKWLAAQTTANDMIKRLIRRDIDEMQY